MKTLITVFRNGHLWDPATKKRIVLRDRSEVVITVSEDDALQEIDPNNKPPESLRSEEKQRLEMELEQANSAIRGFYQFRKIMNRGEKLFFAIKAGIRHKEKTDKVTTFFELTLLEDLYIVRVKPIGDKGRVEPCACEVISQSGYELPYFESVYATSLNDAYSKTYVLYFNLFGKGTINVYEHFYTQPKYTKQYQLKNLRTFTEQLSLPL